MERPARDNHSSLFIQTLVAKKKKYKFTSGDKFYYEESGHPGAFTEGKDFNSKYMLLITIDN